MTHVHFECWGRGGRNTSNHKAAEIIFFTKIFIEVTGLCESDCFLISYPQINWHQATDTELSPPRTFHFKLVQRCLKWICQKK